MTHSTKFPVSAELQAAFSKNEKGVRFLKVSIKNETLELEQELNSTGAAAAEFEKFKADLDMNKPMFFLFKEKAWGERPWVLIAWIPDSAPVQERMTYSASIAGVKETLGETNFQLTIKRYSDPNEWSWDNYKGFSASASPKPYSKLELAQQELDRAEIEARKERENLSPKAASGFHTVSFPFTSEAEQAVSEFKSGSVNWIQLTLDDSEKFITSKSKKQVSHSDLSREVDANNACFYLYKPATGQSALLVYSCPDGCPAKQRMVYSTSKSSTAEKLQSLGLDVKKLDIRSPVELTADAVRTAMSSRTSGMFKPTDPPAKATSSGSYSSTGGRQFDNRQFDSSKPVFQRAGFNKAADDDNGSQANLPSKKAKTTAAAPSALRVLTGGSARATPKGVVLPPEGAYQ